MSGRATPGGAARRLGPNLRRAFIGYQQRLDGEMAAAGFAERGFPDGRVLRLCARPDPVTASAISRELGISRQGAAKIVAGLRQRGYVARQASTTDGREKPITLTARGRSYLDTRRAAARRIEGELRQVVGTEAFEALSALLEALGVDDDQVRLRDYLRQALGGADGPPP